MAHYPLGYRATFQDTLDQYSRFDLTNNVIKETSEQLGGGGFSDVFRSEMHLVWHARQDLYMDRLLSEIQVDRMQWAGVYSDDEPLPDPDCLVVAVKRLRLWGRPIPKVEKV